jgi:hypothetical protein
VTQPPAQLDAYLAHFQWRVLQDALTEATAEHWEHRAHQLDQARPRPGDYPGNSTPRDRALRHRQLTDTALACRRHATLIRQTGLDAEARAAIAHLLLEGQVA